MNIYTFIKKTSGKSFFIYSLITIILLGILRKYNVKLNVIIALIGAYFIIMYMFEKDQKEAGNIKEQDDFKLDNIKPKFNHNDKVEIIDYLYSIQNFYVYNPPVYEKIVDDLNSFFIIHDNLLKDNSLVNVQYSIAETKKDNILNNIHSLILTIPNSEALINKYNESMKQIEKLLNKYLNEMIYLYDKHTYNNGLNINHKIINEYPKPYTKNSQFDFY